MDVASMYISSSEATHTGLTRSYSSTDIVRNSMRIQRSYSENMLCYYSSINKKMQRSSSDSHLCYAVNNCVRAAKSEPKLKKSASTSSVLINLHQLSASLIPRPIRTFLFDLDPRKDIGEEVVVVTEKRSNWVERMMEIHRHWSDKQEKDNVLCDECHDGCDVHYEDNNNDDNNKDDRDGGEVVVDNESFTKMLNHVSWSDAKLLSKLAFLCNMAYVIPQIKAIDLRRYYGLEFVTSSVHKKIEIQEEAMKNDTFGTGTNHEDCLFPKPDVAYEIATRAACYVHSRGSEEAVGASEENHEEKGQKENPENPEKAACIAAASTITSVVAANEKQKLKAARDLVLSSPVEWFICDDPSIYTRYFVIQGSDSLASWQANLMFEPAKFEGTEVLVHRGIYEAAKGIYEQFLPEILAHVNTYGDRAKIKFTGHSLGGGLSLLVDLMLLMRKTVSSSTLLPVVTFGSPFVFCGGSKILEMLGLDEEHVHFVMMHRDIVPRAFSCSYPNFAIQILNGLNRTFRTHPCLNKKKSLYTPMGKIYILQPDEQTSPKHPFLAPGSSLYTMDNTNPLKKDRFLRAFLDTPHPAEALGDLKAYGSQGAILRDHDSSNYLKAVNQVIRQHTRPLIKNKGGKQENVLWPVLTSQSPHAWNNDQNLEDNSLGKQEIMTW